MSRPAYNLRSSVDSLARAEPDPVPDLEPGDFAPELQDDKDDPYYYGWRERWEKSPDGAEKLRLIPLTYKDLLDPQEGDRVTEDSIHRSVTDIVAGILTRRYEKESTVAVWRNLKLNFVIPGLTSGPGPDICLMRGVRDRDRKRTSFRLGEEPGEVRLGVEVVSQKSAQKDYKDILKIYARIGMEEYIAIRAEGLYLEDRFELRGWRRNPKTKRMNRMRPDRQGRLHSKTTGLLFGTGADGCGLVISDALTGERLRTPDEERRAAEERNREMMAEIERLRAQLQDREEENR